MLDLFQEKLKIHTEKDIVESALEPGRLNEDTIVSMRLSEQI